MAETRGPLERRVEAVIDLLAEHQEETLRAIRDRDDLVFQSVKNSVGPEARPTERWVAVVDFVFQGALECIAIGAEGDRVALLEAETDALGSARALDRANRALVEGDEHGFIVQMQNAEAALTGASR